MNIYRLNVYRVFQRFLTPAKQLLDHHGATLQVDTQTLSHTVFFRYSTIATPRASYSSHLKLAVKELKANFKGTQKPPSSAEDRKVKREGMRRWGKGGRINYA